MKYILNSLIQLFCLFPLFSQERFDIQFMLEGHLRKAIIVKPSTPPPTGGYPIVFMLHGTSQDGPQFYDISGWKELGETENFITVFPTSLNWCYLDDGVEENSRRWVNGQVTDSPCPGPPQNYVSDVNFLKLLAKKIADTLEVNSSMIFASGFSNGSGMIHKLAIDAGDVFAACAGTSSFLPFGDSSKPIHRIPVWVMIGTNDDRFIRPPFTEIPYGGDSVLVYFKGSINRMLACQGLTETFTKVETPIAHTYDFAESQPGEMSQLYRFTLINNMFHIYPNGTNFRVDAPKLFWEFFKSVTKSNTSVKEKTSIPVAIYPIPSNDKINVEIPELVTKVNFTLTNLLGQIIFKQMNIQSQILEFSKSNIGAGIYILELEYNHQKVVKKLIFN